MKVNVQKLHPAASLPTYATPGAACFDLRTIEHGRVPARGSAKFRTGLAFEVPAGHVLKVSTGSTGKFYSQIVAGAPFELLLAADDETPARLVAEGHAVAGATRRHPHAPLQRADQRVRVGREAHDAG